MLPSTDAIEPGAAPSTRRCTSANIAPMGLHYAHTLRLWREQFVANWQHVAGARLRRPVLPDVGVLPRLLRGRLPHRLPRRGADPHRALTPGSAGGQRRRSCRRRGRAGRAGRGCRSPAGTTRQISSGAQQRDAAGSPAAVEADHGDPQRAAGRTSPPTSAVSSAGLDAGTPAAAPTPPSRATTSRAGRRQRWRPAARRSSRRTAPAIRRPQPATRPAARAPAGRAAGRRTSTRPAAVADADVAAHAAALPGPRHRRAGTPRTRSSRQPCYMDETNQIRSRNCPCIGSRLSGAERHRAPALTRHSTWPRAAKEDECSQTATSC